MHACIRPSIRPHNTSIRSRFSGTPWPGISNSGQVMWSGSSPTVVLIGMVVLTMFFSHRSSALLASPPQHPFASRHICSFVHSFSRSSIHVPHCDQRHPAIQPPRMRFPTDIDGLMGLRRGLAFVSFLDYDQCKGPHERDKSENGIAPPVVPPREANRIFKRRQTGSQGTTREAEAKGELPLLDAFSLACSHAMIHGNVSSLLVFGRTKLRGSFRAIMEARKRNPWKSVGVTIKAATKMGCHASQ
mmetsp:Transcript_16537/g.45802  ORF Transcript_16537/g.45802 Transcript_16537/m.45802 type:complete len:245 (+) Transcript_16537:1379-2113(+)